MTLRLILGPANARKAGRLLDDHAAASAAGRAAWLVVPTSVDVDRFRRELTGGGGPSGSAVRELTPFGDVMVAASWERRLLQLLGDGRRVLGPEQRRGVALAAIKATPLDALAPAARSGWLAAELIALREELATTGDLGGSAEAALESWSRSSGGRDTRGRELAALLRGDAARLAQLAAEPVIARIDRAALAEVVGAALRERPDALGTLHLALSGFDDLDPVQRALVLAVSRSSAEVSVSLPYAAGREALTAARDLIEYFGAGDPVIEELGAHESGVSVAPELAQIEARLYEQVVFDAAADPTEPLAAPGARLQPQDAPVVELRGGGPDEELALIAEYLVAAKDRGSAPDRMAVVVASPARQGPAILAALHRAGLRAHLVGGQPARTMPSIAAILALLRLADEGGDASDLVAWLSGPGGPTGAGALDAAIRRRGARSRKDALYVWHRTRGGGEVPELQALLEASRRSALPGAIERATAAALRARIVGAFTPGAKRSAAGERDLRSVGALLTLLDDLANFAEAAPDLGLGLRELRSAIEESSTPADREPPRSIAIVGPLGVRTRHLEVVVVARAQRSVYPATEGVRRILGRGDRAALVDHGWPTPARPDHAAAERYLAYEIVARPTQALALAWHDGDGDGKPAEPSPLIAEVRRAAGGALPLVALAVGQAGLHGLGAEHAARLAAASSGPDYREAGHEQSPLLATQVRDRYAVGALQTASRCAASWLVDHHLRPKPLNPDAAPLTAGRLRHELLAEIVKAVVSADGGELGPAALRPLGEELQQASARRARGTGERQETQAERLMRERVVAEIEATLPALCGDAPLAHQPAELELAFGTTTRSDAGESSSEESDEARPPVVIERAGERLVLSGRIDRLDASPEGTELVVVDYKGANVGRYKQADWESKRELQAGLYALVAEALAGGRAIASLYQPVPGPISDNPRGASSRALGGRLPLTRTDNVDPEQWDALLDVLVGLAAEAQRQIDDGVVAPQPAQCSDGGCRYPWLCREVPS